MKEISDRRSIRKYKEDAVNKADIEIILKRTTIKKDMAQFPNFV